MSHLRSYAILFFGGATYALGFPSAIAPALFPLSILGFTFLLFYLEKDIPLKASFAFILAFSLGFYLTGYYWIPQTLQEFGELPFPLNYIVGLCLSLVVAPYLWVYGYLSSKLKTFPRFQKQGFLFYALSLSLLLTILEVITPQQFPGHIGMSWLALAPRLPFAPFLGAPIYSLLSYLVCFALVDFLRNKKIHHIIYAVFSVFVLINLLLPLSIGKQDGHIKTRIVQANIGNLLKIDSEKGMDEAFNEVIGRYTSLSTKTGKWAQIDLTIWPETAYPPTLDAQRIQEYSFLLPRELTEIQHQTGSELLFGGYNRKPGRREGPAYFREEYNTAFFVDSSSQIQTTYHKQKLIPFGETLPLGPLTKYIAPFTPAISFFAIGNTNTVFTTKDNYRFITPICYEILFTGFMRNYLNSSKEQPHFILNLTNDSWYGDTAEPEQHLFLAKWRALEFNMPIIRSTNTGITSIIYPDGSESQRLGVGLKDALDVDFRFDKNPSPSFYQRFGVLTVFLLGVLILGLISVLPSKDREASTPQ